VAELRPPDPVWQLYLARRFGLRTPGQQIALAGLLTGSRRPNRVIAAEAGCHYLVVRRLRHLLEDAGVIDAYSAPSGRNQSGVDLARKQLAADPSRANLAIAALAGCGERTVTDQRHEMEAADEICVYRYGKHAAGCPCAPHGREFVILADGTMQRVITAGDTLVPWERIIST
jgi:hypothetical protein